MDCNLLLIEFQALLMMIQTFKDFTNRLKRMKNRFKTCIKIFL